MSDLKSQASKNAAPGKPGGLSAEIQSRIGHQLRAMYDDVVRQGVPDRFVDLIRKLDGPAAAAQAAGGVNDDGSEGRD
jgi:hypothetical protein